jgi:hypothetical protein
VSKGKKTDKKDKKSDMICKFYKNGRCNKSDEDCRFLHPKICRKFNQFGPKNGINKGCEEKCGFFHPNACKNSVKYRTCSYQECRFFHLKDTKITKFKATKQNTQTQKKSYKKQENGNFSVPTKNRFSKLETDSEFDSDTIEASSQKSKQGFQKVDPSMAVTLQKIMNKLEGMEHWQKTHKNEICQNVNASQKNWRIPPPMETVSMTQEQKARWDSQNRNSSQSQTYQ